MKTLFTANVSFSQALWQTVGIVADCPATKVLGQLLRRQGALAWRVLKEKLALVVFKSPNEK
jgi:hypothetical protein